jgi:hypothetical protein
MTRITTESERKSRIFSSIPMASRQKPFAENRYSKYRLERESIVLHAPEASGVYGLFNALWIYVGESDNIRARLLEHLAGDNPCINRHQPSGFAFELISAKDRGRRWRELIDELEPLCKSEPSHIGPACRAIRDPGAISNEVTFSYVDPRLRAKASRNR